MTRQATVATAKLESQITFKLESAKPTSVDPEGSELDVLQEREEDLFDQEKEEKMRRRYAHSSRRNW